MTPTCFSSWSCISFGSAVDYETVNSSPLRTADLGKGMIAGKRWRESMCGGAWQESQGISWAQCGSSEVSNGEAIWAGI